MSNGNISEKLTSIYNSVQSIKSAIESKGVDVGSAVLSDYASKINEISVGSNLNFYKCNEVIEGQTTSKLFVQNAGTTDCNGYYQIVDSTATGDDRVWKHESNNYWILYNSNIPGWVIQPSNDLCGAYYKTKYRIEGHPENPYGNVTWIVSNGQSNAPTVTLVETSQPDTWTGYKAVQDATTGIWSYQSSLTSNGLTYGIGFTPVVGKLYNTDATVTINSLYTGLPTEGMIFYAALSEDESVTATGDTITKTGSPTFSIIKGIPCCTVKYTDYITISGFSHTSTSVTISYWAFTTNTDSFASTDIFQLNGSSRFGMHNQNFLYGTGYWAHGGVKCDVTSVNVWHHVLWTVAGSSIAGYIDGVLVNSGTYSLPASLTSIIIRWTESDNYGCNIAGFRIYNRILTAAQITALASEFTPTN